MLPLSTPNAMLPSVLQNRSADEQQQWLQEFQREFRLPSAEAQVAVLQSIQTLIQCLLQPHVCLGHDVLQWIEGLISEMDGFLSEQLNRILHHHELQRLEGTWRGLFHLVSRTETDALLKIKIFHIKKSELAKILQKYKGVAWDQSPIFKKIYEEEYGQFGGEPFGCWVGDYEFDHTPPDVDMLGEIAKIAAASHTPFIAGAAPTVLQMHSWQELGQPRDLSKIFTTPEYVSWRALRAADDTRYLGLTLPRFLARVPYGMRGIPVTNFYFEEDTTASDHSTYTWCNAA